MLGVPSWLSWASCNFTVYAPFENFDFESSYRNDIPILLAGGKQVLFYNGDEDLICNFYGTSALLDSMEWPGESAFNSAANTTWTVNGAAAGSTRNAQGLTYVVVGEAGHMVPHDQPANALELLNTFLSGNPFN